MAGARERFRTKRHFAVLTVAVFVAAACQSSEPDKARARLDELRQELRNVEASKELAWKELDFCRAALEVQTTLLQIVLDAPVAKNIERSGLMQWVSSLGRELRRLGPDADHFDRTFVAGVQRVVENLKKADSWSTRDAHFRRSQARISTLADPHSQKYLCGGVPV